MTLSARLFTWAGPAQPIAPGAKRFGVDTIELLCADGVAWLEDGRVVSTSLLGGTVCAQGTPRRLVTRRRWRRLPWPTVEVEVPATPSTLTVVLPAEWPFPDGQ